MTVHLVHGFNVYDGGRNTVARLAPYFPPGTARVHNYGWTGLLRLRRVNRRAVDDLMAAVKPGDFLIGHSNGALICWEVAQRLGAQLGGVVVINPSMRRDTLWPEGLPVLCLANATDWVVQMGRAWGRLVSLGGLTPHGWGAAGRYGFTAGQRNVVSLDTSDSWWTEPVKGHSGVFHPPGLDYWGAKVAGWVDRPRGTAARQ